MPFSIPRWGLLAALVAGYRTSDRAETLFSRLPASATGIDFENRLVDTEEVNVFTYRNYYNGGGRGGEPAWCHTVTERTSQRT